MAAHLDHAGVTGSAGRFPQSGRNPMPRTFTMHGRFHVLTISHSGVRRRVTLVPPRRLERRLPLVPRRPTPSSAAGSTAASRTSTSGWNARWRPSWTGSKHRRAAPHRPLAGHAIRAWRAVPCSDRAGPERGSSAMNHAGTARWPNAMRRSFSLVAVVSLAPLLALNIAARPPVPHRAITNDQGALEGVSAASAMTGGRSAPTRPVTTWSCTGMARPWV
jgi:hypothetical protein